jgi:hypothetical protein
MCLAGHWPKFTLSAHAGVLEEWCFTVRWRWFPERKPGKRGDYSLNLFEADLADF